MSGTLIDAHSHFLGPTEHYRGPHLEVDETGNGHLVSASSRRTVARALWDIEERVAALDAAGVVLQMISPVAAVSEYAWDADSAYARSVNESLADACERSAGRLVGLGCVSADDITGEVQRCVAMGLSGIQIGTTLGGRDLDDPALEPLWQSLEAAHAIVAVHPVAHGRGVLRRAEPKWEVGVGMPTDTALAICALVFGGVLTRYPRLRISVAAGGGTFAWSHSRLSLAYSTMPDGAEEAIRRIYVDTATLDPSHFPLLAERFGSEHILLGSDAPFLASGLAGLANFANGTLPAHDRGLFTRNARKFLGIDFLP